MDEVRRFRFLVPVSVFVLAAIVLCPVAVEEILQWVHQHVADNQSQPWLSAATLLSLGAAGALGLGFINSTIVHAILYLAHFHDWDFRGIATRPVVRRINKLAGVKSQIGTIWRVDQSFVAYAFAAHTAPPPIKDFLARRWEMFVLSVNSANAIALAIMFSLGYSYCTNAAVNCIALWLLTILSLLALVCAVRSRQENAAMIEYLSRAEKLKWPHLNATLDSTRD